MVHGTCLQTGFGLIIGLNGLVYIHYVTTRHNFLLRKYIGVHSHVLTAVAQ
jgi:hypothetical protein